MKVPPKSILLALVSEMDALKAHAALTSMGYNVSKTVCREARRAAVRDNPNLAPLRGRPVVGDPTRTAENASARLEEAMCALYAKTAKRLGCKLETAAIILNYSPAQIAKMRRAA